MIFKSAVLFCFIAVLSVSGCSKPTNPTSEFSSSPSGSNAASAAKKVALISMTSDPLADPQAVNMGLTFAGFCVDEGYEVAIFFNVHAVTLPTNTFADDFKYLEHAPLKTQLKTLKERGVELHVCPVCMKDLGIADADIISEAFVTSKPKLFAKLGADTMVLTY
jgi:predicted peroxiredoxin